MSAVESPCINVCRMNPRTRLCDGCARTLREIGSWGQLTREERQAVMAQLPARQTAVNAELPARQAAVEQTGTSVSDAAAPHAD